MEGTPIQDLYQMESYGHMQSMQGDLSHTSASNIHQAQHAPYNQVPNYDYKGEYVGYVERGSGQHEPSIEELTKDINDTLPLIDSDTALTEYFEERKLSDNNPFSLFPTWVRGPILLLIIFVILSQPIVRDNIGKVIKVINADESGNVSFVGILIYGIILTSIYTAAHMYIL